MKADVLTEGLFMNWEVVNSLKMSCHSSCASVV
jgi:hypothetical protein